MDDDQKHELRADLIEALMRADGLSYADAERVVESFGKICPRCGAIMDEAAASELAGTIWA